MLSKLAHARKAGGSPTGTFELHEGQSCRPRRFGLVEKLPIGMVGLVLARSHHSAMLARAAARPRCPPWAGRCHIPQGQFHPDQKNKKSTLTIKHKARPGRISQPGPWGKNSSTSPCTLLSLDCRARKITAPRRHVNRASSLALSLAIFFEVEHAKRWRMPHHLQSVGRPPTPAALNEVRPQQRAGIGRRSPLRLVFICLLGHPACKFEIIVAHFASCVLSLDNPWIT